ncbi:TPA: hypothetical protein KOR49_003822 [Clostridioides difficile]|uniref:Uncharacterized protein n=1 Tax=Clostridioides difficile TaxID=1496 RepID=A0AAN6A7G1_CLODI|nr:hypothetical protein [Clostridioides difficile]EGT3944120.1 hypothetical protein [Clostridioides difficile]MBG0198845.1 hypothetical protein [Clostridioides difficile]MCA0574633.1 hypothetical protein [Clostridioides difficile]SJT20285.1 Uncharacterised protein [Clostridioides difficile]VHT46356.1 Uncharacterised protein [Clostridioides difficile]
MNKVNEIIASIKKGEIELKNLNFKELGLTQDKVDEICMVAVKENGLNLKCVENKTPEICFEAIKQNKDADMYRRENKIPNNPWINI